MERFFQQANLAQKYWIGGGMSANRHIIRAKASARVRACTTTRSVSVVHWLVVVVAFLALTVQSFVVQTHIHMPLLTGKAQTLSQIGEAW